MQTIAVDARPLSRGRGGIQRYTREMLKPLIASNKVRLILYTDIVFPVNDGLDNSAITIRSVNAGPLSKLLWLIYVPIWSRKDKIDLFWSPRHHLPIFLPKSCQTATTIHDFVWKVAPSTMPIKQLIAEAILMPLAIRKSNKIICPSSSTHKQLMESFPYTHNKSLTILHGADSIAAPTELDKKRSKQPRYFLTVGTLEPRKNYLNLIKAFNIYRDRGGLNSLIIVGENGWNFTSIYEQAKQSKYNTHIEIINDCSDSMLSSLYTNAQSFVSTSLYEGFGLPPQEADLYGLPLLLSSIDAYLELYPNANVWVDHSSEFDIADGLEKIASVNGSGIQSAPKEARSWEACAKELLECLSSI